MMIVYVFTCLGGNTSLVCSLVYYVQFGAEMCLTYFAQGGAHVNVAVVFSLLLKNKFACVAWQVSWSSFKFHCSECPCGRPGSIFSALEHDLRTNRQTVRGCCL